mmetsp:Transcript_5854/g.10552  ORF Transcript_5854/g.10552 Transcript_5854/m.10552 type:complete len:108 (+) Transcript_5854:29-352(+)
MPSPVPCEIVQHVNLKTVNSFNHHGILPTMKPVSPIPNPATMIPLPAAKAGATPPKNASARPMVDYALILTRQINSAVPIDAERMDDASVPAKVNRVPLAKDIAATD